MLATATALAATLAACGGSDDEPDFPPRNETYELQRIVGGVLPVEVADFFGQYGHAPHTVLSTEVVENSKRGIFSCSLDQVDPPVFPDPPTAGGPWTLLVSADKNIERQDDECIVRAQTTTGELTVTIHGVVDSMVPRGDSRYFDGGMTGQAGRVNLDDVIRATDSRPARVFINPSVDALPFGVAYDPQTNVLSWQADVPDTFDVPVYLMDDAGNITEVLLVIGRNAPDLQPAV